MEIKRKKLLKHNNHKTWTAKLNTNKTSENLSDPYSSQALTRAPAASSKALFRGTCDTNGIIREENFQVSLAKRSMTRETWEQKGRNTLLVSWPINCKRYLQRRRKKNCHFLFPINALPFDFSEACFRMSPHLRACLQYDTFLSRPRPDDSLE